MNLMPNDVRSRTERNLALFFISVLGLFLELLLIRWIGTEVNIFAYLQNTILVVCFMGLGMGCMTCRQPILLRNCLAPLLILVLLLSIPQSSVALRKVSLLLAKTHPDSGDNQKDTKNIENEMKLGYQRYPEPDHHSAHDQGTDDTPD